MVLHICNLKEAIELEKVIKEKISVKTSIAEIGPIIGLNVGSGAIGLGYSTEKDIED